MGSVLSVRYSENPRPWYAHPFGVAIVSAVAAVCVQELLARYLAGSPFLVPLCAVVVSALYGGLWPALLTVAITALATGYLLLTPSDSIRIEPEYLPILAIYVGLGASIGWLAAGLGRWRRSWQEGEERFRTAQELSLDGFQVMEAVRDADGKIVDLEWVYANPAALNVAGTSLVGKRYRKFTGAIPEAADVLEAYIRVIESGTPHDREQPYTVNGQERWFRNMAVKLGDGVAVSFSDITERRRMDSERARLLDEAEKARSDAEIAADAAQRSEAIYRAIGESIPFGIWIADASGRIEYVSECFAQFLDLSSEEVRGDAFFDRFHPDDAERVRDGWKAFATRGEGVWTDEYRVRGRDGQYRTVLSRGVAIRDDDGRLVRWAGVNLDVTAEREQEMARRAHEARLQLVLAQMPSLLWTTDRDLRVTSLLGQLPGTDRDTERIRGRSLYDIAAERGETDLVIPPHEQALRGEVSRYERRSPASDRQFMVWVEPLRDSGGGIVGTLGLEVDITERRRMEEALRLREEELRLITDSVPALISYVDAQSRYRFVNRQYEVWFGMPREQIVGLTLEEFLGPEVYNRVKRLTDTALRGEPVQYEQFLPYAVGGARHTRGAFIPHRDERGRVQGFFAMVQDVTEEVKVREALRAREEEFRAVFDLAGSGKAQADADTGRFVRVNRKFCNITGYTPEELLHLTLDDLTHPGDREQDAAAVEAVLRGDAEDWHSEKRFLREDGAVIWVSIAGAVVRDGDGRPFRMVTVIQDVTDRKRAEEAVRESEERLRVAVQHSGIFVLNQDRDLRYTWAYNLLNLPPETLLGRRDEDLLPPKEAEDLTRIKRRVLQTERGTRETVEFTTDGEPRMYDFTVEPLRNDRGEVVGITGAAYDITRQVRIEQELRALTQTLEDRVAERTRDLERSHEALRQSERLAAIGQMITGLSHESRNALQRSYACLQMLERRFPDNDGIQHLVREGLAAHEDLRRVFEEVQGYAAPLVLDRRPTDPAPAWRAAWEKVADVRQGRDISFEEHLDTPEVSCEIDAFRMQQVFRNLFENAVAACSDPAHIAVYTTSTILGGQPALRITVRDNGPGLNEEQAQRIFEPFYTTKTRGTGLGMSIVKRIVEAHGGRIEARPAPGSGLDVVIELPCKAAVASTPEK